MNTIKNFAVLFVVIFSLLTLGCDHAKAEKTIRDFEENGAKLSTYGTKLITAFGDAEQAGEITRDQLKELNAGTRAFVNGVGLYRTAIADAKTAIASGQPLPPDTLGKLDALLASQVIDTFLGLLVKVGALPLAQSQLVQTAITGIRLTILAIKAAVADAHALLNATEVTA
jgi:hypothetical protein